MARDPPPQFLINYIYNNGDFGLNCWPHSLMLISCTLCENIFYLVGWLIIDFVLSKILHFYGEITIAYEVKGCEVWHVLEAGIFMVPHPPWHGVSGFVFSSGGPHRPPPPFSRFVWILFGYWFLTELFNVNYNIKWKQFKCASSQTTTKTHDPLPCRT